MSSEESNPLQASAEWINARVGCLTASRAYGVVARSKRGGGKLKAWEDTMWDIITERLTGIPQGSGTTVAMQWGIDHEAEAREEYENATGEMVDLVGFIRHPDIDCLGASPDGLVGEDGLVEIKCPYGSRAQIERVAENEIPEPYKIQMAVQLLCTGRRWCDFVSYDPRQRIERFKLFIKRYEPTDAERQTVLTACIEFLDEVQKKYAELTGE